jgi:hypothetical protein
MIYRLSSLAVARIWLDRFSCPLSLASRLLSARLYRRILESLVATRSFSSAGVAPAIVTQDVILRPFEFFPRALRTVNELCTLKESVSKKNCDRKKGSSAGRPLQVKGRKTYAESNKCTGDSEPAVAGERHGRDEFGQFGPRKDTLFGDAPKSKFTVQRARQEKAVVAGICSTDQTRQPYHTRVGNKHGNKEKTYERRSR